MPSWLVVSTRPTALATQMYGSSSRMPLIVHVLLPQKATTERVTGTQDVSSDFTAKNSCLSGVTKNKMFTATVVLAQSRTAVVSSRASKAMK